MSETIGVETFCCIPSRSSAQETHFSSLPHRQSGTGIEAYHQLAQIPGGAFMMGTDDAQRFATDGEGPVRRVTIKKYCLASTVVTNDQFATFVAATGYITEAERFGWSFVFDLLLSASASANIVGSAGAAPWWLGVTGAQWRFPEGHGSSVDGRGDHPVVHVSWNDAMAYCKWGRVRLPTEAEWERAARGGMEQKRYPWGDELTPRGVHHCNIWQGDFPHSNSTEDGYIGTAPAASFPANGYGLHNVSGNVWEWCADWFSATYHINAPRKKPLGEPHGRARVLRGGSYLCHHSYCNRYRVAARSSNSPDSTSGNTGFRVASDA